MEKYDAALVDWRQTMRVNDYYSMHLILHRQRPRIMKATRLYTRAYLTRMKCRGETHCIDDLSKIEIVNFSPPPKLHSS